MYVRTIQPKKLGLHRQKRGNIAWTLRGRSVLVCWETLFILVPAWRSQSRTCKTHGLHWDTGWMCDVWSHFAVLVFSICLIVMQGPEITLLQMLVAHDTGTSLSNGYSPGWSVVVCLWCNTSILFEGINDLLWLFHNSWKWLYPHFVTAHIWNGKRVQKIHSEYTSIAKNYIEEFVNGPDERRVSCWNHVFRFHNHFAV